LTQEEEVGEAVAIGGRKTKKRSQKGIGEVVGRKKRKRGRGLPKDCERKRRA